MKRDELGDLVAFLAVAEECSFTRAAARMGTSQSSLSYSVRRMEERMGVRLLTRTTRSVVPTEAGDQLIKTLRPAFAEIETGLDTISALGEKMAGNIRLTSSRQAAVNILFPAASRIMSEYPDIQIEISVDQRFTDIVTDRFDAGVRLGEQVEKDMIAVRIGPDMHMVVAGSRSYFEQHTKPLSPHDLTQHVCLNLRLPTLGGLYTWEFEKDGKPLNVRVKGQFTCNDGPLLIQAAINGLGLVCLPNDQLGSLLDDGTLVPVLQDWCPPFPGYHLYYPSRRQSSPAFRLLVEALRYRG